MHFDIRGVETGAIIEGDICIVGAGAAGLSIAMEFNHSPVRVILLEGGGFEYDGEMQELYRGQTTGQPYYPLTASRLHHFGGTTGLWGGQCSPLDGIDFVEREWVENSGWPIKRSDLDEFYARAHQLLGLGPYNYRVADWRRANSGLVELLEPNDSVESKLWRFVPPSLLNFNKNFRSVVVGSKNVTLYTYANATKVLVNDTATSATGIAVTNHAGRSHVVKARHYVLGCCAIQNARLLLASNDRATAGLGNAHDIVGRYFMEHVELKAAELWLHEPNPLKLYQYRYAETSARAELAITAGKQREHAILNGTASLIPLSLARAIKPMIEVWSDDDPRKSLENLVMDREYSDYCARKFHRGAGRSLEHKAYELFMRVEQAPTFGSRVGLDTERDALGVPRVKLHWELSRLEKHTVRTICELIARQVGLAGVGRVRLFEYLRNEADNAWPSFTGAGWHHIGTTRMADDPKKGVVNRDCQLHGVGNLFVAGSSCFPTSGAVNPTLSIIALSLRLADHLKRQLQGG